MKQLDSRIRNSSHIEDLYIQDKLRKDDESNNFSSRKWEKAKSLY